MMKAEGQPDVNIEIVPYIGGMWIAVWSFAFIIKLFLVATIKLINSMI